MYSVSKDWTPENFCLRQPLPAYLEVTRKQPFLHENKTVFAEITALESSLCAVQNQVNT